MTKEQAVATAGERLGNIEAWMRRACYAMVVCAVLLAALVGIASMVTLDYLAARSALRSIASEPIPSFTDSTPSPGPR